MQWLLRTSLWSALLWAVLLTAWPVTAQTASSSLRGTVRSEDGKAVIGAIVQVRSETTGAVRVTTTDDEGRYRLLALPVGTWTVVARTTEGAVSESVLVGLRLQESPVQDLTVGAGVTERVRVRSFADLIDKKETAGKLRVSAERVSVLPIGGRVFTDLALLDSSVRPAAEGAFYGEAGSVFIVNGATGRSNSFLVDGLDNNDLTSGTALGSFFSQQVIEEFVLLTHRYSPEFGRATGGILNIITKQGGNEARVEGFLEGSLGAWGETGNFIDMLPPVGSDQTRSRQFSTGFNFSGPFKQDKAFYFFAFEHQNHDGVIGYTGVDRSGIPGGRFSAPVQGDNIFLRTDFNLSPNNRLMLRVSYDDRDTAGVNVGGLFTPEAGFLIKESDLNFAGSLTTIASSSAVFETRFAVSKSIFDQLANSDLSGVSHPAGIFGGNPLHSQLRDETKFQIVENVTWTRGDHTWKFGLDITRSRIDLDATFNPNGSFLYDSDIPFEPGDCGNINISDVTLARTNGSYPNIPCAGIPGVDDDGDGQIDEDAIITSYPVVFSFVFGQPSTRFNDTKYGVFVQDHWQPTPSVFLEYGLRYDYSTYKLPSSARVASTIPNGGSGTDHDNLAPRFGFTWTPDLESRTVIRGGAGLFYDKLVLAFPAVSAVTSGTQIGLFFPRGFAVELDEQFVEQQGIDAVLPSLFFVPELTLQFSTTTKLETPYAVQANIGVDIPTGGHSAFRTDLIRSQGYHLPLLKDLNPVIGLYLPGAGSCPNNLDPTLEEGIPCHGNDPSLGSIAVLATEGRSWYTGLNVGWRYQGASAWIDASYTLSRAEDTGFDPLKGGVSIPQDSENFVVTERGRGDGDRKHRVVISGDLPVWSGFRISGVLTWSSGLVFNVTSGTDLNVDGILTDRPDGVARNAGEDTDLDAINTFRTSTKNPNPATRFPISDLKEPAFTQLDLRIRRPFVFKDGRGTGEVYLQIFNLLDRENIGLIDGRIVSENFGTGITLAGPPRTIVTGFRIGF